MYLYLDRRDPQLTGVNVLVKGPGRKKAQSNDAGTEGKTDVFLYPADFLQASGATPTPGRYQVRWTAPVQITVRPRPRVVARDRFDIPT